MALRQAINKRDLKAVAASLAKGAKVNCSWTNAYIENETPLMLASGLGCAEIVELLLKSGADVTQQTRSASGGAGALTALHYALNPAKKDRDYLNTVRALIKAGISLDTPSNNGTTPLANAAQSGWQEAVALLIEHGAKAHLRSGGPFPPLHGAAQRDNNLEVARLLLASGSPVDCRDEQGTTALMTALLNGKEDMVELLLQAGAEAKAVNALSQTTLMCAALFARDAEDEDHTKAIRLLKLLMDRSVAINAKDGDGKTACDYLEAAYEPGARKFLKASGGKPGKQVKG